jgi:hypothetical protein
LLYRGFKILIHLTITSRLIGNLLKSVTWNHHPRSPHLGG